MTLQELNEQIARDRELAHKLAYEMAAFIERNPYPPSEIIIKPNDGNTYQVAEWSQAVEVLLKVRNNQPALF